MGDSAINTPKLFCFNHDCPTVSTLKVISFVEIIFYQRIRSGKQQQKWNLRSRERITLWQTECSSNSERISNGKRRSHLLKVNEQMADWCGPAKGIDLRARIVVSDTSDWYADFISTIALFGGKFSPDLHVERQNISHFPATVKETDECYLLCLSYGARKRQALCADYKSPIYLLRLSQGHWFNLPSLTRLSESLPHGLLIYFF